MMIHCEVCGIREEDNVRISEHTRLGIANDIKLPLRGGMIGSPDEKRRIPAPFPTVTDWKAMRCPRCHKRPFIINSDDFNRCDSQGGPDKVYTDDGWFKLPKDQINDD